MLKPLFLDLAYRVRDYAYRLSCVSSTSVLKSDMESSFPVDAVTENMDPLGISQEQLKELS